MHFVPDYCVGLCSRAAECRSVGVYFMTKKRAYIYLNLTSPQKASLFEVNVDMICPQDRGF